MRLIAIPFLKSIIILIFNTLLVNFFAGVLKIWRFIFFYLKAYFNFFIFNFFIYKIANMLIKFLLKLEFSKNLINIFRWFFLFLSILFLLFFKYFLLFLIVLILFHFGLFIVMQTLRQNLKNYFLNILNYFFIFLGGIFVYSFEYYALLLWVFYILYFSSFFRCVILYLYLFFYILV
jgi:hypothetical protein